MFFVYNKDRIISAAIALSTVLILFMMAGILEKKNSNEVIETSQNITKFSFTEKIFSAIEEVYRWKKICHTIVTK